MVATRGWGRTEGALKLVRTELQRVEKGTGNAEDASRNPGIKEEGTKTVTTGDCRITGQLCSFVL